ncbi:lysophospholipid acyltransferase 1 isoform X2 [Festucalex cinctus]
MMGELVDNVFQTTGSQWLLPVSEYFGFPITVVNFVACQLFALLSAFWFRLYLSPEQSSPLARHAVATLLGVTFIIFCFGWYSAHLLLMVLANYLLIIQTDISNVHRYSMVMAMGYLTACHVSRVLIFKYEILSTDFSGPLMIVTQKITSLAFQLHDGMCKKAEELTSEQKQLAVTVRPSLLEYLSYNLNFLSVLVGPCNNYKDYIEFIEGTHISGRLRPRVASCNGSNGHQKFPQPSPRNAVCQKLLVCCGCLLLFFIITPLLPINYNFHPHFVSRASFITRLTYAVFSMQAARPKFYFAWKLGESINNAAGFGFSGMDANGKASWNLLSNVDIVGVEGVSRASAASPDGPHLHLIGPVARPLPGILLLLPHRHLGHHGGTSCSKIVAATLRGLPRLEAGLRHLDVGVHSDGHWLHFHALSAIVSRTHHGLLQLHVLPRARPQHPGRHRPASHSNYHHKTRRSLLEARQKRESTVACTFKMMF